MNQNRKNPILKGKLTKISAALFAIAQTPGLLSEISMTAQVFTESAQQPITYLSLVAAVGVIWGGLRRAINYQLPTLPRITIQRATPVSQPWSNGMTPEEIETAVRYFKQNFPAATARPVQGFPSPFERDDA